MSDTLITGNFEEKTVVCFAYTAYTHPPRVKMGLIHSRGMHRSPSRSGSPSPVCMQGNRRKSAL